MAASLTKRKNVTTVMHLLDEVTKISNSLEEIERASHNTSSLSKMQQRIKLLVQASRNATNTILDLTVKLSDNATIRAHKHMSAEDVRPAETQCKPKKSKRRSSDRHAANVKKRKVCNLNESALEATLLDLHQSGRLRRPEDVCEFIHGDNSVEHKKCRTTICKLLTGPKFNVGISAGHLRNVYTKYKKFLDKTGPPLPERFGCKRPPMMPVRTFLEKMEKKLEKKEHQQKDLRDLTAEVLSEAKETKFTDAGGSKVVVKAPSATTIDTYLRVSTNCRNIEHVGKKQYRSKPEILRSAAFAPFVVSSPSSWHLSLYQSQSHSG